MPWSRMMTGTSETVPGCSAVSPVGLRRTAEASRPRKASSAGLVLTWKRRSYPVKDSVSLLKASASAMLCLQAPLKRRAAGQVQE